MGWERGSVSSFNGNDGRLNHQTVFFCFFFFELRFFSYLATHRSNQEFGNLSSNKGNDPKYCAG